MDIMELGAIGELVGGVAVIATLIYLASPGAPEHPFRSEGRPLHALNNSYTTVYGLIAQEPDLAEIYAKGLAGGRAKCNRHRSL